MTREQVEQARAAGYQAGYTLASPSPNPYAPEHVPEWRQPRTARERAALAERQRGPRILARVWRLAYQSGLAAYRQQPRDGT